MGGKAKPTKHTAADLKAREKVATQSRGGGQAGKAERDAKTNLKGATCQEPGCAGLILSSLTVRRAATTHTIAAAPAILFRAGRCPTRCARRTGKTSTAPAGVLTANASRPRRTSRSSRRLRRCARTTTRRRRSLPTRTPRRQCAISSRRSRPPLPQPSATRADERRTPSPPRTQGPAPNEAGADRAS